jgi:cobalt-zinc-cadmium efflux system outer membrane protein
MSKIVVYFVSVVAGMLYAEVALASPRPLTFEQVMALARKQAPAMQLAIGDTGVAKSAVIQAGVFAHNPEFSGELGPRWSDSGQSLDWGVSAQQWIPLGAARRHRQAAAGFELQAAQVNAANTERLVLRQVADAFVLILYWQQRLALSDEYLAISDDIVRAAAKRVELGDAAAMESTVASLAASRVQMERVRGQASLRQAQARLALLLGLDPSKPVSAVGKLRALIQPVVDSQKNDGPRADVKVLKSKRQQYQSELKAAQSLAVPDLGIAAGYEREESNHLVKGTLALRLPLFDHGQGQEELARAKLRRIEVELKLRRLQVAQEVQTATAIAKIYAPLVERFAKQEEERLTQVEHAAASSYAAGAIPLGELLVLRRELASIRLDYLELMLAAAQAEMQRRASVGGL